MNTLTCGCEYIDSLIVSYCELHKFPGPESHKDGKGIIIRDLEAKVTALELQINEVAAHRDRLRDMLNDIRGMALRSEEELSARVLRRIEDETPSEKPKSDCTCVPFGDVHQADCAIKRKDEAGRNHTSYVGEAVAQLELKCEKPFKPGVDRPGVVHCLMTCGRQAGHDGPCGCA